MSKPCQVGPKSSWVKLSPYHIESHPHKVELVWVHNELSKLEPKWGWVIPSPLKAKLAQAHFKSNQSRLNFG